MTLSEHRFTRFGVMLVVFLHMTLSENRFTLFSVMPQ